MDLEKRPAPQHPAPQQPAPEGCLTVAIRIPVRIVVLVLVVPVRMVWDALVVVGRFLRDSVLRPLWRALVVWPLTALWRYVVVPLAKAVGWLGKVLLVIPLVWLYRYVLTPVGHGIAWVARGIVAGLEWVYARVLTPIGHGIVWLLKGVGAVLAWIFTPIGRALAWCVGGIVWLAGTILNGVGVALYWIARILLVLPAVALWRWVLAPVGRVLAVVGREVWDALGHAWRIAGHISLAVGRFLGTLFRWIFVEPVRWVYRTVLTPVGHVIRDVVLRPVAEAARSVGRITRAALASARESVREARADFRRMLFGEPREREAVARREPTGADTRTLGSSTTALTKD
ncbi:hypothetical protein [Streptomyces griseorubiginosus]|uniref:hypothetical protein n=1 Tax=Streptomyces griseorubiginosus TaxID=67304 RepID=UPI002E7FC293|nr:hypothetical protein [Streptomyces griseorubiginosus]WUB47089.1 hypothetical protein OHN19_28650 [Streptomyces griseorubiginosus]WUB55611.1 hypothetical protein OG942_28655 [Streptomyces griseorubiginosus]